MTHAKTAMPKYENYKNFGISWMDKIPYDWKIKKVKFINDTYNGNSLNENNKKKFESEHLDELPYISSKDIDVDYSTIEYENGLRIPKGLSPYRVAPISSSLICIEGGSAGRKIAYTEQDVCFVNKLACFKPKYDLFPKFGFYLLKSQPFQFQFQLSMSGLIGGVPISRLNNFSVCLPSLGVQEAIAAFLDEKTQQIDKAIRMKEQQITLLKERKQIIIQNAVTKGLDSTASMKNSGIDWIGEIPKHWKVEKLFGLCRFVRGNSAFAKDELLSNGQYVALQYGKTYKVDEVDYSYKFYVNEEFYNESQVVNFGDVIFISTSETIEDLGHSAIYNKGDVGLLGGEQLLIKPNKNLLDHYYIYYSTKAFSKVLRKYATGIKVFRFNINDLKTIYTAVPPKEEQAKIASYINESLEQVDKAIDLQQAQINKLKEYKASLINSAVTGKIKVTGEEHEFNTH